MDNRSLYHSDVFGMTNISIIIVNYNTKNYLYDCIKSIIINNSKLKIEIIVVDNLSTDGSIDIVKNSFPFVTVIENNNNFGYAKGNNIGIAKSSGKYLMLINPDVVLIGDCLTKIYEYMDNNVNIGLLGPKILARDGNVQRSCMGFPTIWNTFCRSIYLDKMFPKVKLFGGLLLPYWSHDCNKNVDVVNGCFWAVRRQAMEEVGLLDEIFFMYGEDIDWCRRYHKNGWDVVYFKDAEAIHFGGISSSSAPNRFYIELQKANLTYWNKYNKNKVFQILYWFILVIYQITRILFKSIRYIYDTKNRGTLKNHIIMYCKCLEWLIMH